MSKLRRRQHTISAPSTVLNDAWYNAQRGVGDLKTGHIGFCPEAYVPEEELSNLADFYWLARRIVRALPEAAIQDEILWEKDADKEHWKKIDYVEGNDDGAFLTACVWARTHGVSLLVLGQDYSGSPEEPFKEGVPVEWLEPIASPDFIVGANDLNTDKTDFKRFEKPEFYTISGRHRLNGTRIHHSRVVHFAGPTLSDIDHSRDYRKMQQASVLDAMYMALSGYGLSWSAFDSMIQQGAVPIWKLKGLISGIGGSDELIARLQLQQETVSVTRAIMLDADSNEEYKRESVPLTDIPELMKMLAIQIAAVGDIPAGELFGKLIAGLGDDSDGEQEKWDRKIRNFRAKVLAPRLGKIMPGAKFEWKPVQVEKPIEQAQLTELYWKMGGVLDEEIRDLSEKALGLPNLTPEQIAALRAKNAAASARQFGLPPPPGGEEEEDDDPLDA